VQLQLVQQDVLHKVTIPKVLHVNNVQLEQLLVHLQLYLLLVQQDII